MAKQPEDDAGFLFGSINGALSNYDENSITMKSSMPLTSRLITGRNQTSKSDWSITLWIISPPRRQRTPGQPQGAARLQAPVATAGAFLHYPRFRTHRMLPAGFHAETKCQSMQGGNGMPIRRERFSGSQALEDQTLEAG